MAKLLIWVVLFLFVAGPAGRQSTTKPPSTAPAGAVPQSEQFKTEEAAKSHCPGDTIVWATLSRARTYHLSGDRYFGKTRRGAYMCLKDAEKDGLHQVGRRRARSTSTTSTKSATGATH